MHARSKLNGTKPAGDGAEPPTSFIRKEIQQKFTPTRVMSK